MILDFRFSILDWAALLCLAWVLSACAGPAATAGNEATPPLDPLQGAAAEATAIVQQARATAMVLQAQAQATALVEQAMRPATDLPPATTIAYVASSPAARPPAMAAGQAIVSGTPTPEGTAAVEILSVSFAAEGGMIMVQFHAPPTEAEKWWPGNVSVEDEATGAVYDEVPVMPKVGPLIGRPKVEGQLGYVMLVNEAPGLRPEAVVTVVLGTYRFEHIRVH